MTMVVISICYWKKSFFFFKKLFNKTKQYNIHISFSSIEQHRSNLQKQLQKLIMLIFSQATDTFN